MRKSLLLIAPLALILTGCATLTAPTSVSTLAEAEQAATLATQAADTFVTSAQPAPATLAKIAQLSVALHSAVNALEKAQADGQPLDFAAVNSALQALTAFEAANAPKGI